MVGIGSDRMSREKREKISRADGEWSIFRHGEIYEERRENQTDRFGWERTKRTIESNG
jgi:hypothetical protein